MLKAKEALEKPALPTHWRDAQDSPAAATELLQYPLTALTNL
jgi:hypothetical protein